MYVCSLITSRILRLTLIVQFSMAIQPGIDRALSNTSRTAQGVSIVPTEPFDPSFFTTSDLLDEQDFSFLHRIVVGINATNLRALLNTGVSDVDKGDANGRTALLWAAWRGQVEDVKALLDYGADPGKTDYEGYTALAKACEGGHVYCVRLLISGGAPLDSVTKKGYTHLHVACGSLLTNNSVLAELINNGARLDMGDNQGQTPLHTACNRGSLETVGYLLDQGADINAMDGLNRSPTLLALLCWREDIFCYLVDKKAALDNTPPGKSLVHVATWGLSQKTWAVLTEAAQDGRLNPNCVAQKHQGHDIEQCFSQCRDKWYPAKRGDRKKELQIFRNMIQAVQLSGDA